MKKRLKGNHRFLVRTKLVLNKNKIRHDWHCGFEPEGKGISKLDEEPVKSGNCSGVLWMIAKALGIWVRRQRQIGKNKSGIRTKLFQCVILPFFDELKCSYHLNHVNVFQTLNQSRSPGKMFCTIKGGYTW